jgi:RNA polymerase sigma-70 factor, Bacteroides expansion family 1
MRKEDNLIVLLREGNEKGFQQLFSEYYSLLCVVAYDYVKDDFAAETIVGDVMLAIWKRRDLLDNITSLRAYLLKSVRNRSIDYLRQNNNLFIRNNNASNYEYDAKLTSNDHMMDSIIYKELESELDKAIMRLPTECRNVFCMSRFDDFSYDEIAEKLDISVNTVKYHIKRALSSLREELREHIYCLIFLMLSTILLL